MKRGNEKILISVRNKSARAKSSKGRRQIFDRQVKMYNFEEIYFISGCLFFIFICLRKRKLKRSCWVNPFLKERNQKGRFSTTFEDLLKNEKYFHQQFHMSPASFQKIYERIEHLLLPQRISRPDVIGPKMKLAVVLEFLTTGSTAQHISSTYRIASNTFLNILKQVCRAIIIEFKDQFITFNKRK